jgi:hypothetical protein
LVTDFPSVDSFPIFLYFKKFILLAFLKLRKQDFEGAKKWLSKKNSISSKATGYYNYLHGIMLAQTNITKQKYFKSN